MLKRFRKVKRLIILGLSAIILFTFASCSKADITDYKTVRKNDIQTYANTKIKDCYSPEKWSILCGHVEDGKKSIDDATKKSDVDLLVTRTVKAIDGVTPMGLYTLEFAYEYGFLNGANIRDIGFYHNGEKEWVACKCDKSHTKEDTQTKCLSGFIATDFEPTSKVSETLSEATQIKIKQRWIDYIEYYLSEMDGYKPEVIASIKDSMKIEDLSIGHYYGTYNGYAAIMFESGLAQDVIDTPTIANTVFYYNNSNRILVWDNK